MIPQISITDSIYYVGVNDRTKDLFESLWPLPHGVSYNSYLIVDEKVTLIDTVDICYSEIFFRQIERIIGDKDIDYLVINHMEPDHSGSIGMLKRRYPNLQIIGNKKTFNMLKAYYPDITEDLITVTEKDEIETGKHKLSFIMAPMVHWPEVMFTYDSTDSVLFSADAFGTFGSLDGHVIDSKLDIEHFYEEMYRYYSCIVGKYGPFVQKVLTKVKEKELPIKAVCSTHGPVWTDFGFERAMGIYDQLSRYETEKGAVVALEYGVEGFVTPKHLVKEDGTSGKQDEKMMFKVIEFSKGGKKIILSHSRIFEDARDDAAGKPRKSSGKLQMPQVEKTTLGDVTGLEELKAKMENEEKKK